MKNGSHKGPLFSFPHSGKHLDAGVITCHLLFILFTESSNAHFTLTTVTELDAICSYVYLQLFVSISSLGLGRRILLFKRFLSKFWNFHKQTNSPMTLEDGLMKMMFGGPSNSSARALEDWIEGGRLHKLWRIYQPECSQSASDLDGLFQCWCGGALWWYYAMPA